MALGPTSTHVRAFKFQVDIAYAPFVEQFHPLLLDVKKCDFTSGRPRLASWIEVECTSLFCSVVFEYWQIKIISTYMDF